MKKVKSIHAGLIAAVLLASVSTSAIGQYDSEYARAGRAAVDLRWAQKRNHWHPWNSAVEYFFRCTIGQECAGSQWR